MKGIEIVKFRSSSVWHRMKMDRNATACGMININEIIHVRSVTTLSYSNLCEGCRVTAQNALNSRLKDHRT